MAQTVTKKTTIDKIAIKKTVSKKVVSKPVAKTPVVIPQVASAPATKTARILNKNLKISPRKLRLTVNAIKVFSPSEALNRLKFTNTKAARILIKSIKNVIADAKNNFNINPDTLKFGQVMVNEGMKIKRMDKSHGSRFARGIIQKRHSRLTIEVTGQITN